MSKVLAFLWLALCGIWWNKPQQQAPAAPAILHARNGLPHFFDNIRAHRPVVIAYLGGSITQAGGYRVQTSDWFGKHYSHSALKAVNAGVGGTGSNLGAFRLQEDVLQHNPDLVFVEFAVNDLGTDSLTLCDAMEGIVRQIKKHNSATDICFLYTVSEPMLPELQQGQLVRSMRLMEQIAAHYGLPSINLSIDVLQLLQQNKLVFRSPQKTADSTRIVFTNDGVHPTTAGHGVYTQTIIKAIQELERMPGAVSKGLPARLYAGQYEQTRTYPPQAFQRTAGWQPLPAGSELAPYAKAFPDLVYSGNPQDSIIIRFRGTLLGVEDILGPSSCGVTVAVDGQPAYSKRRFDVYCGRYRRHYYFLDPLPPGEHTVVLKPDTTHIDKTKIVKPEEMGDTTRYRENYLYIGRIMVGGEVLQ